MAASIKIAHDHGRANLPVRVPHLMPFHIQHTGPAPVSTYFRINPPSHAGPLWQLSSTPDPSLPSGDSQTELTTATVNTKVVLFEEKENLSAAADADRVEGPSITATPEVDAAVVNVKAPALPVQQSGPIQRLSESAKRFISSFRGRTVHGVEVTLPKGYAGIVLRGDTNDQAHPRPLTGNKSKRRPVRNSRRRSIEEEELDEMSLEDEEKPPVRVLKPTARFDSFVLWHPDIPVDEGQDEYLRSLSEWTNIASEIHQSEFLPT
ncbi:Ribonuclease H2, subunit C [Russula decolorans]